MKKLLIFDAYGTLFSTGTGSVDAAAKILSLQSRSIDPAAFYREWKKLHRLHMDESNADLFLPERLLFQKDLAVLYRSHGIDRPADEDVRIMLQSLTGRKLFPDVVLTLEALRRQFRIVIGSTTDTAPLLQNLSAAGLTVDAVYTSESIRKYKPHPAFYRHILSAENCLPDEAVFIGDSLTDDVLGPGLLGITTVWLNRSGAPLPADGPQPRHVISDLSRFPALF